MDHDNTDPNSENGDIRGSVILKYQAQKGTDSQGVTYEENMAALYALKFCLNAEVKDMLMASNADGFGTLDDLILRVEYHTENTKLYLIKFQCKENENYNIKTSDLSTRRNKMFSLEKYKRSYEWAVPRLGEINQFLTDNISVDDIRVCIVSNANLQDVTAVTLQSTNVTRNLISNPDLIDTKPKNVNTFDIDNPTTTIQHEYSTFFQYFRFYDRQVNCKEAKTEIKCLLKSTFGVENEEVTEKLIKFITAWFKQERVLTKKIVKNKLQELLTGIGESAATNGQVN